MHICTYAADPQTLRGPGAEIKDSGGARLGGWSLLFASRYDIAYCHMM